MLPLSRCCYRGALRTSRPLQARWRALSVGSQQVADKPMDLAGRAEEFGLKLSPEELQIAAAAMHESSDGNLNVGEYKAWLASQMLNQQKEVEKVALRGFIEKTSQVGAMSTLRAVDYFGTAVFSMTGTVVAAEAGMNIVGCGVVGAITAIGGGTVSNIMTGRVPVFWMKEPEYLWVCIGMTVATFVGWPLLFGHDNLNSDVIYWADTAGLAAFSIIGAQHGIQLGLPPIVCAMGGVIIVFGGIMRDVLCQRTMALAGSDPYAASTLLGSSIYVASRQLFLPLGARIAVAASAVCGFRVAAKQYSLHLPSWGAGEVKG